MFRPQPAVRWDRWQQLGSSFGRPSTLLEDSPLNLDALTRDSDPSRFIPKFDINVLPDIGIEKLEIHDLGVIPGNRNPILNVNIRGPVSYDVVDRPIIAENPDCERHGATFDIHLKIGQLPT